MALGARNPRDVLPKVAEIHVGRVHAAILGGCVVVVRFSVVFPGDVGRGLYRD